MKIRKTAAAAIAAWMTFSMTFSAAPVMAAPDSVFDVNGTGSVTIHKIVENNGANKQGDGHEDASVTNTPLDQIGFSYRKIADWVTVADDLGQVSTTGLYFTNLDQGIFGASGIAGRTGIGVTVVPTVFSRAVETGSAEDMSDDTKDGMASTTVYRTKDIEDAWAKIIAAPGDGRTYTGETALHQYLKENGTAMALTDTAGKSVKQGLALGMYAFGETDISAHDGIDPETGAAYVLGQEETNPEAPIVESPAKPFLMTFPMTNISEVKKSGVTYPAGTIWEYDFHVYPKDQTTSVTKRIIDPDEAEAGANLRTNEDFQIGEIMKQVIFADAPALQKAYDLPPAEQGGTATVQAAVTHKTYKITDTMTEGFHFKKVTKVLLGAKREQTPEKNSYFAEGFTALTECQYTQTGEPVVTGSGHGDYFVTGADGAHTFSVTLTENGLKKLDALTVDSQVAVFFEADLDSAAKIGTDDNYLKKGNMNRPTLTLRNSNTLEKSIEGNRVYVYTYELDVTKTGLTDLTKAAFTVARKETGGSSTPLSFIQESAGVYHIYDVNGLDKNAQASAILSTIHPDAAGKLNIKGFDSKTYTFKETATQGGFDLLKETFDVTFNEETALRDGELTNAVLSVDGMSDELDIDKGAGGNGGLVKVTIENHKTVTLRTGGEGRRAVMTVGGAAAVFLLALALYRKKKLTA